VQNCSYQLVSESCAVIMQPYGNGGQHNEMHPRPPSRARTVICLSTFLAITPLGARIDDLEKEGYVFEVEHEHGDYVYRLVSALASKRLTS
jgi:hypothetical protein